MTKRNTVRKSYFIFVLPFVSCGPVCTVVGSLAEYPVQGNARRISRSYSILPHNSREIKDFVHFISLFTGVDPLFRKLRQSRSLGRKRGF